MFAEINTPFIFYQFSPLNLFSFLNLLIKVCYVDAHICLSSWMHLQYLIIAILTYINTMILCEKQRLNVSAVIAMQKSNQKHKKPHFELSIRKNKTF